MKRHSILIALAVMLMAVPVVASEQPVDATSVTAPVIVEAEGPSYDMPWPTWRFNKIISWRWGWWHWFW